MQSNNPVFSRSQEFNRGGYATFGGASSEQATRPPTSGELEEIYAAPSATTVDTGRMTIDDVVVRTAAVFGVLLLTAVPTYLMDPPAGPLLIFGAAILGLVLSLVISFSKTIRPPLILAYGAIEGVFVGGISDWYATQWDGIVPQAVLGTLAAFSAMLALYKIGAVRATPKFQRTLMIAMVGYLVFALINIVGASFGLFPSVYSSGLLGVAVSAFGVVLASLFLVLDFDFIEQGIRNGLPERFAWMAAFGLVVTLIWLYLEILRLIAILRGDE
jgi:uncharacterized YccA/Bax inhibitor family protein